MINSKVFWSKQTQYEINRKRISVTNICQIKFKSLNQMLIMFNENVAFLYDMYGISSIESIRCRPCKPVLQFLNIHASTKMN